MNKSQIEILEGCFDESKTRKRIRTVIVFNSIAIVIVIWLGFIEQNLTILSVTFIVYLAITAVEKIGYGHNVIAYKRLVRMAISEPEKFEDYRSRTLPDPKG